jgi:Peptidase family M1 domain
MHASWPLGKRLGNAVCSLLLAGVVAVVSSELSAAEWRWLSEPTPSSSQELIDLHEKIHTPRLAEDDGIPVQDLHWREEFFDLHLRSGALFLERPIRGYPTGAFFVGDATVSFSPTTVKAKQDLEYFFGASSLESEPISHVLFFTLRGESLAAQLGVDEVERSAPLRSGEEYEAGKSALRQLGLSFLHAFLNREGRSRGGSWVLLPVESIRTDGSEKAYFLYSFDPGRDDEIQLASTGQKEVEEEMPHKFFFHTLVSLRATPRRFRPHGRVDKYLIDVTVGQGKYSSEETATITFTPTEGVSALILDFTPRMEIQEVVGPDGKPLPFVQWKYLDGNPNYDQHVIVDLTRELPTDAPFSVRVSSGGSLFEPWFSMHWLAEEDTWLPLLDDQTGAFYELFFTVPEKKTAIGAGELVDETVVDKQRRYHFRTTRPHKRSTLYFGEFVTRSAPADDTTVEAYVARTDLTGKQNLKFAVNELTNMVKVYNRLFVPLETPVLRVAGTPTSHGRGFEGLILLSERAGFDSSESGSDIFRAHEVAHQWWGNVVQPRRWPEDRWLSEAFAEYAAMEYYQIRFEKPQKTREQIYEQWVHPILEAPRLTRKTLTGEKISERVSETVALVDGTGSVYTKGPLVLHMLRYMFGVKTGSDDAFWQLLRDFLETNRYQSTGTEDFVRLVEEQFGDDLGWFWDQWYYGLKIPVVRWSQQVTPHEGRWLLTVDAKQEDTAFTLLVPVHIHFKGDRNLSRPLLLEGPTGRMQVVLPEKPRQVTLNDNYQALVELKE